MVMAVALRCYMAFVIVTHAACVFFLVYHYAGFPYFISCLRIDSNSARRFVVALG